MNYQIRQNAGPKETVYQFARLSIEERQCVDRAHRLIWNFVTQNPPPFNLTGLVADTGMIFEDPIPPTDYHGSIDGAWIWSNRKAYFRFRIIVSKGKLDTWEYGRGPHPRDLSLSRIDPIGKLEAARG